MGAAPCMWTLLSSLGKDEFFSNLLEPTPSFMGERPVWIMAVERGRGCRI